MGACRRGFTLIEVVVSIALFALLMGIVYSGFTVAVRAYDAAESRVDEVERMRVISAFIRRSVSGAHALAIVVRRKWILQFDGAPHRLRYIVDLPGYVAVGGLHELVLELEPHGERDDLVLRRRPLVFDRLGEPQGEFQTRVLSEGIDGFELRFYGSPDGKEDAEWRDEWASAKNMPLLVELTITPATGPPWPLLQVHPQVDGIQYVRASGSTADAPPAAPVNSPEEDGRTPSAPQEASVQQASPQGSGGSATGVAPVTDNGSQTPPGIRLPNMQPPVQ